MAAAPTVQEFIDKAAESGWTLHETQGKISGPYGVVSIHYLSNDGKFTEPLPTDFAERIGPETIRRLCNQVGLDVGEFGLNLG